MAKSSNGWNMSATSSTGSDIKLQAAQARMPRCKTHYTLKNSLKVNDPWLDCYFGRFACGPELPVVPEVLHVIFRRRLGNVELPGDLLISQQWLFRAANSRENFEVGESLCTITGTGASEHFVVPLVDGGRGCNTSVAAIPGMDSRQ
jgi:hypothetical protein